MFGIKCANPDVLIYNPVVGGFVENDNEYLHNSAKDYMGIKGLVNIIIT
jgi:hypothetical protein